jgi:hypothetical protein
MTRTDQQTDVHYQAEVIGFTDGRRDIDTGYNVHDLGGPQRDRAEYVVNELACRYRQNLAPVNVATQQPLTADDILDNWVVYCTGRRKFQNPDGSPNEHRYVVIIRTVPDTHPAPAVWEPISGDLRG